MIQNNNKSWTGSWASKAYCCLWVLKVIAQIAVEVVEDVGSGRKVSDVLCMRGTLLESKFLNLYQNN